MASGPPKNFIDTFRWPSKCLEWLQGNSPSPWFGQMKELPTSSFFSGYGCLEMALHMISENRKHLGGDCVFSPSYQVEIQSKARLTSQSFLPEHTCQHTDIMRLLGDSDRKMLRELEKNAEKPSQEIWDFLLTKELVGTHGCFRHHQCRPVGSNRRNSVPNIFYLTKWAIE